MLRTITECSYHANEIGDNIGRYKFMFTPENSLIFKSLRRFENY